MLKIYTTPNLSFRFFFCFYLKTPCILNTQYFPTSNFIGKLPCNNIASTCWFHPWVFHLTPTMRYLLPPFLMLPHLLITIDSPLLKLPSVCQESLDININNLKLTVERTIQDCSLSILCYCKIYIWMYTHTYNKFTLSAEINCRYNSKHTFRDSHFNSKLTCKYKEV